MTSIICRINLDGKQQTTTLQVIKKGEDYFVPNPYADRPLQPALVQLDPKRIRNAPESQGIVDYTGILLEIRTIPEELA